jgi:hypothetical protein
VPCSGAVVDQLPRSAAELVRDELDRLKRICGLKTHPSTGLRARNADGLALEKMAVLSSLTPDESIQ